MVTASASALRDRGLARDPVGHAVDADGPRPQGKGAVLEHDLRPRDALHMAKAHDLSIGTEEEKIDKYSTD